MQIAGTFIQGGAGRILIVSYEPEAPAARTVIVVPAFGEEMNKSRRLLHDTGVALRERGVRTVVPDLYGTGDSEGEIEDARWSIWIEDLRRTLEWTRGRGGSSTVGLLLVRLGAVLFAAAERELGATFDRAVAWQPVAKGADALKQLLRTKIMAMRMAGAATPGADAMLQALLTGPEPTELSGYLIVPELARAIHGAAFSATETAAVAAGLVLELDAAAGSARGASAQPREESAGVWQRDRIAAERFWLAAEPGPNPALVRATTEFLAQG